MTVMIPPRTFVADGTIRARGGIIVYDFSTEGFPIMTGHTIAY
jgi:hypothetical protein